MSTVAFARLRDDYNLPAVPGHSIRHSCGVQDEVIHQIGLAVLSEMMRPTAAGRMLVETSSLLLAARLAHAHAETELIRLLLVTALSPVIGYDKASKIAHYAMDNDLTLKAAALKLGFVTEAEFDRVVDPKKMVKPYVAAAPANADAA